MKRGAGEESASPDAKKGKQDLKEEEEAKKEEAEEETYELFVAYQEHDEEEKENEDEEEDLGSSDSDTSSDEEHTAITNVVQWADGVSKGILGQAQLDAVKEMSRKIYDDSDEGFREIDDAVSRVKPCEKPSAHIRVVGMLILRTQPPAEITQVFVLPTLRDCGIGKRLVRRALDHVSNVLNCSHVDCFAICGSGSFYERLGFVEKHKRDRASKKDDTPCADRAEMVMELVPGTQYDIDSDDDDGIGYVDDDDDDGYDDDDGGDDDGGYDDDD